MLHRDNGVKIKLNAGESVVGLVMRLLSPTVVELAGLVGYDYVWIDMEHGTASFETAENLIRAADAVGIEAMVRLPDKTQTSVLRALEAGASILCVPQVDTADEARGIAMAARYYPQGERGFSTTGRGLCYGLGASGQALLDRTNQRLLLMVQIETKIGLQNAEAICSTDGVDIIFIGLGDLSQQLGYPGQYGHPEVQRAAIHIVDAAHAAGKHIGIPASDYASMQPWLERGVRLFFCAVDVPLLTNALEGALAASRPPA